MPYYCFISFCLHITTGTLSLIISPKTHELVIPINYINVQNERIYFPISVFEIIGCWLEYTKTYLLPFFIPILPMHLDLIVSLCTK